MKPTPKKANLLNLSNSSFYSWRWFQELLQSALPHFSEHEKYVTLFCYLSGKGVEYSREEIIKGVLEESEEDFCKKIPSSFRLTNLQIFNEDIRHLCHELSPIFKRPVSCNLYFTPGEDKNCFDYHSDLQESYILQLRGTKEWAFPFGKNNDFIRYVEGITFNKDMFHEKGEVILLGPAEQLHVPYALAHKVEIKGTEPSIHLTFSSYEKTRNELINAFIGEFFSSSEYASTRLEKIGADNIEVDLNELKEAVLSLNTDELSKKIANKFFGDDLEISKFGRIYSKKKS